MSTFKTATPDTQSLDPDKRVRYSLGMVLGKDDLDQEQTFFLFRDRLHNRSLHGYGTVCGLGVRLDGTEVQVSPGLAVNPRGEVIRVSPTQCGDVADWLSALMAGADAPDSRPSTVYVVLCYRECETDVVPVPGVPCRTEDETVLPSRITASFELRFQQEPPNAAEDAAVERFAALLRRLVVIGAVPQDGEEVTEETMVDRVVALASGPLDEDSTPLYATPATVDAILDAAFRAWVTRARPELLPDGASCWAGPPDEACVLLAAVGVAGDGEVTAESLSIDDSLRPYLLHTDLIQESMLGLSRLRQADHGELAGLEDDDHPQYLLVSANTDPARRALLSDLPAGNNRIRNLAAARANTDAVRLDQIIRRNESVAGDLRGEILTPEVRGLLGRPIRDDPPAEGRYLRFQDGAWVLAEVEGGGEPDTRPILPFVTVHVHDRFAYHVWFNLDAPGNRFAVLDDIDSLDELMEIRAELPDDPDLSDPLRFESARVLRNFYRVSVQADLPFRTPCLRFEFFLARIRMARDGTLLDFAEGGPFRLSGFTPESGTVTAFVFDPGLAPNIG